MAQGRVLSPIQSLLNLNVLYVFFYSSRGF